MTRLNERGQCVVCHHKPRPWAMQQRLMRRNKYVIGCFDLCHDGNPLSDPTERDVAAIGPFGVRLSEPLDIVGTFF